MVTQGEGIRGSRADRGGQEGKAPPVGETESDRLEGLPACRLTKKPAVVRMPEVVDGF